MGIQEIGSYEAPLPLLSLNHVSILCRSVLDSMRFYEEILGFGLIKRPSSFKFNGAWLYNYGFGIHLLENPNYDEFDTPMSESRPINPKDNHISFQCTDVGLVKMRLEDMGMKYVTALVEDEGIKVEQVFFHDPDGYMIELCNCENIPIVPISSASGSFKARGQSFKKTVSNKCGFMENVMMRSLTKDMMNFAF
ncbi:lactoylglutathione lyase/glyoxalase I family protein [Medicago truncatula]|uniref:Lactoylglutathione lyase/glyoxalase I family protein n=1 Tax=Medicago truncatula TaxID=3880 RepID=G7LCZ5_MEDTR|nr:lactoylglutathione lyase/glyoxalase I family protein [Medicago truncatula]